jgi:hypothetical protein
MDARFNAGLAQKRPRLSKYLEKALREQRCGGEKMLRVY